MAGLCSFHKKDELLACIVYLDLFVDVIEDGLHLVLQAIQLMSFPLQLPLVFLVALLQLCTGQIFYNSFTMLSDLTQRRPKLLRFAILQVDNACTQAPSSPLKAFSARSNTKADWNLALPDWVWSRNYFQPKCYADNYAQLWSCL